jgi:ABC-type uncharacterized transport system substrate-binding protein
MNRRAFLSGAAVLLAAPLAAEAQRAGKMYRIGVLWFTFPEVSAPFFAAFRQGLVELGYVEGRHMLFEQRWAQKNPDRYAELASELLRVKVDIIVAGNLESSIAARRVTSTTPIVLTAGGDPVRAGLVASLARPGGNVTGMSEVVPDLAPKLLQMLREIVPTMTHVGVLWDPANPSYESTRHEIERATKVLALQVTPVNVTRPEQFEEAFATITRERLEGLIVYVTPITQGHRKQIVDFALGRRLPVIYSAREFVDAGGLLSYGPNHRALFHRAATYVDKILKGARPADLPVEQPTKFELVINLKTAKALGLTIPPSLLQRADQVIE